MVQQSIMNFGILLVQSLVNSFGVATMAAFAAGVKIDSFAYSPAQDFANGFATFVAQNTGAGKPERVKQGIREAALLSLSFCAVVSALVFVFARPLLTLFIDPGERVAVSIGKIHFFSPRRIKKIHTVLLYHIRTHFAIPFPTKKQGFHDFLRKRGSDAARSA